MCGVKKVWLVTLASGIVSTGAPALGQQSFRRGDANVDGTVDISDALQVFHAIFQSQNLNCQDAGDSDDNGLLTIGDGLWIFGYLFAGGDPPLPPGPDVPGPDETLWGTLGCEAYEPAPPPKLADLTLGFEGPSAIPGAAGETTTFDVFATLTTANASTDMQN